MAKDVEMTIVEHLDELRTRLIISVIAVVAATIVSYFFIEHIMAFMKKPIGNYELVFITPQEMFITNIKLAFFTGLLLALPVVLYEVWAFVSTGLLDNERKYILIGLPVSLALFAVGGLFCFFFLLPVALAFLLGFAIEGVRPMISISRYISFVGYMIISVGLVFQMPLVILVLAKMGLVTYKTLAKRRQYALLIILTIAAIITPSTDVFTLLMLSIPIFGLYEISIWLTRFISKRESEQES